MGIIIQARTFSPENEKQAGILKPIIYCCTYGNLANKAVSINEPLSKKLIKAHPNQRTLRLEQYFNQVIKSLPDGVIVKDFDVMFNPNYQVDVLKVLIAAGKKKSFSLIWPGKYEDGKLIYAEEGYRDYKVFRIENYDVTCII